MSQPAPQPSWKQEVNQRLAAHKSRKGPTEVEQDASTHARRSASTRAAQAAARVAARYAKVPSFSEMQAAEARAALRAAEDATRAALQAQVFAQTALFELENAGEEPFFDEEQIENRMTAEAQAQQPWEPEPVKAPDSAADRRPQIRWEADMSVHSAEPPAMHAPREPERDETEHEDPWSTTGRQSSAGENDAIEAVEAAQPIHANLIQFPRQLVATRRMRPRLTGPQNATGELFGQLSIFEVDPSTISIEPIAAAPEAEAPTAAWSGPEWSGIKLDEQPITEPELQSEPVTTVPALHLASFGYRLMATVVDSALIAGVVCAAAAITANHMHHPLAMKTAEIAAVAALVFTGALYHGLFLLLAGTTPGMLYARLGLCTFDDENPTRVELRERLVATALSLVPVGLGVVWAAFDEDHLCWHDRLSRTYLRSY